MASRPARLAHTFRIPGVPPRPAIGRLAAVSLAAVFAGSAWAGGGSQGLVYDVRVVALTGDAAPGLFAGSFTAFDTAAINASGQIVFHAETDGAVVNFGLWSTRAENPQSLDLIAGDDLFPPGVPGGVRYAETGFPYLRSLITDAGDVAFWMELDGYPGGRREGLFRFDGDVVEPIALPDQVVPGLAGATLDSILNLPAQNASGLTSFRAFLDGPGISEANDDVLLVEWFGGLTTVVREGAAAPTLPGRTWAPIYSFAGPQMAANGRLTFRSTIGGGAPGTEALWSGFPGAFSPLLVSGDLLPNGEPFLRILNHIGFTSNDAGDVAARVVFGDPQASGSGIVRTTEQSMDLVAVRNQAGPLGTYAEFTNRLLIDPDGAVVFVARFDGPGSGADTAIVRRRVGQPAEVLFREGEQAFGLGSGIVIDDLLDEYASLTMDASGRTYVRGQLRGPGINNDNDDGVWAIDPDGTVNLVLRAQQSVTVAPFDTRFVRDLRFQVGDGPATGNRGGVNARGDVALRVSFFDGSEAIVHAYQPPFCPADRNADGFITFDDLLIVLADFGTTGPVGAEGDADWDGDTDFDDLLIILAEFGNACQPV